MHMPGGARRSGEAGPLLQALEELEEAWPEGCMVLRAVRDAAGAVVDFECLYANPAAGGRAVRGRRIREVAPGFATVAHLELLTRALQASKPLSEEVSGPDLTGQQRWFLCTVGRLGEDVLVRLRDVTDSRRAVEELEETERRRREAEHLAVLAREHSARLEAEDLAQQRSRELLAAKEKLMHSEKLAVAGQLAAGVGHEINNPLSFVMGNLHFALEHLEVPGGGPPDAEHLREALEALREARVGAERIRDIVRDLKRFARADEEAHLGPVNVHAALEFCVSMAMPHIRHRAQVVWRLGDVPMVLGNEARLGQVFLNLLINAAQSIAEGDVAHHRITLATRLEGGRVVVEVSDTGSGMAPEVLSRIFEPFFTTKRMGEGTGLGLSICLGLVQGMNGELTATSVPGQGSTFRVVLPTSAEAARPAALAMMAAGPRRKRILVIDDEPSIAAVLRRIIGREHEVVVVHSGREALELLERDDRFDRVFCDLMMADLTGMDVHTALEARRPDLLERFVFMTGGSFTERARVFLQTVRYPRIEKPFDPELIRALVAQAPRREGPGVSTPPQA